MFFVMEIFLNSRSPLGVSNDAQIPRWGSRLHIDKCIIYASIKSAYLCVRGCLCEFVVLFTDHWESSGSVLE